jgi:hypothetical protein
MALHTEGTCIGGGTETSLRGITRGTNLHRTGVCNTDRGEMMYKQVSVERAAAFSRGVVAHIAGRRGSGYGVWL